MIKWDANLVGSSLDEIKNHQDEILKEFSDLLNCYHETERTAEYYDTLAGDWLLHFTHLVYVSLKEVQNGCVQKVEQPIPVSSDLSEASGLFWQNNFLHKHLNWAVASLLKGNAVENWTFARNSVFIKNRPRESILVRLVQFFLTSKPRILITGPCFKCSKYQWLGALWRWRGWVKWDEVAYPINIKSNVNTLWRKSRASQSEIAPSNLVELMKMLLPLHVPVALLEGFREYRKQVLDFPVARPQAVYSAYSLHNHLAWKLLVAEWRRQGTLVLYHQHGGGYGVDRINALEDYEVRVSDIYYTLGWYGNKSHIRPLSLPAIDRSKNLGKKIMLCCVDMPKMVYRLHFHPMPGTCEIMHSETYEFLRQVRERNRLVIRPYFHDYGWGFVEGMRHAAPEALIDDCKQQSGIAFSESRLVVHNYIDTSLLETLSMNIPTVCFFDPDTYSFRDECRPLIDALQSTGILHNSGNSAAQFINNLGDDIEVWWARPELQDARKCFVDKYASYSSRWMREWEVEFKSVIHFDIE